MDNLGIVISENYLSLIKGDIGPNNILDQDQNNILDQAPEWIINECKIFQLMVHNTSDLSIRWHPEQIAELRKLKGRDIKLFCHSVFKVVIGKPFSTVIFRDHYLYVCRHKFEGYIIHLPREMDPQLCIEGIGKLFRSAARILAEERVEPITVYLEHVPSEYYSRHFAEFGKMVKAAKLPLPVGLCVDTCHLYASGISLGSGKMAKSYMDEILEIGLPVIMHLNDSEGALGSFVDRHAEIGSLVFNGSLNTFDDPLNTNGITELMRLPIIKIIELGDCVGSVKFIIKNISTL